MEADDVPALRFNCEFAVRAGEIVMSKAIGIWKICALRNLRVAAAAAGAAATTTIVTADVEKLRAAGGCWLGACRMGRMDDNTVTQRHLDSLVSNKMRLMLFVVNMFPCSCDVSHR